MKPFEAILDFLVDSAAPGRPGPAAVDAQAQLLQEARDEAGEARRLNAAFLLALCGPGHAMASRGREGSTDAKPTSRSEYSRT